MAGPVRSRRPMLAAVVAVALTSLARAEVTVRDVRLVDYRIARTKAFVTSKGQSDSCYGIFVLLTADDGHGRTLTALGDGLPRGLVTNESLPDAWAGAGAMAAVVKGSTFGGTDAAADLAAARDLMAELRDVAAAAKLTTPKPPPPDKQLRATLCGFDEAVLDLLAQIHDEPVYKLLGGPKRDAVTVAAMTYNADATADDLADQATTAGGAYGAMRLKIGLGDDADVAKIGKVAAELVAQKQSTDLWVDVNHAWFTSDKSVDMLGRIKHALADAKFAGKFICEQPTDEKDLPALAAVTAAARTMNAAGGPQFVVMADEAVWDLADAKKMVALDAADALNIKIQKCGGLLAAMDIGEYLNKSSPRTQVYVGGVIATDVTSWANLQLCYALPRLDWATSCIPRRAYPVNLAATPIRYAHDKTFSLPTAPGLGTGLNYEHLTRYTRRDTATPATRPATGPHE